ncbi:MAG TPA: hypothetical protein PK886_02305 [Candidatus Paceibacterota bacterium]|nr:hypothetical protein [Candidatus Paceibacterota bacterium]
MIKILNDYQKFFEVAQTNDIVLIALFFFFAFLASIACFFLPLKYYFWYKKIEATNLLLQVLAFCFFGVFAIKLYQNKIETHLIFLGIVSGLNFFINWILHHKIIKGASHRLQIKIKGPTEIMSKIKEVEKEEKRFGTNFIN